jgi:hypothetical protein
VANYDDTEILDVYSAVGKTHDFTMFKDSMVGVLPENIFILVDKGYVGILDYFGNALVPHKATKNNPLTDEQKAFNSMIGKLRVKIEHIIRRLKIFRICKETYRGTRESSLRRVKLISVLCNKMYV